MLKVVSFLAMGEARNLSLSRWTGVSLENKSYATEARTRVDIALAQRDGIIMKLDFRIVSIKHFIFANTDLPPTAHSKYDV